jgi:hypothetical protein
MSNKEVAEKMEYNVQSVFRLKKDCNNKLQKAVQEQMRI